MGLADDPVAAGKERISGPIDRRCILLLLMANTVNPVALAITEPESVDESISQSSTCRIDITMTAGIAYEGIDHSLSV